VSTLLVAAVLVFVGVASGALLWEALAVGVASGHSQMRRELRRTRARLAVGVIGLAIVLWIALGMLTRAW